MDIKLYETMKLSPFVSQPQNPKPLTALSEMEKFLHTTEEKNAQSHLNWRPLENPRLRIT